MAYVNVYPSRINWENEPSINTPINAVNLNKIDYAVYEHDQTLANWDTTKANQSDLLLCVKTITYDTDTGVFVFTWQNGTSQTVDLNIEKIPVSFSMDANGVITMTTEDGTQYTADVGSLIKTYTFTDSGRIDFTVTTDASGNKTVVADIIDGSITGAKLQPNYLADCQAAQTGAETAQGLSEDSAEDAEAWAVGQRNGSDVPSTDPTYENNAKYWAQQANPTALANMSDVDLNSPTDGQVLTYNSTTQKWENQAASGGAEIDDTTTSTTKVWSSQKVSTELNKEIKWSDAITSVKKNLFTYNATSQTINGITFTINSDGSVTIDGTATAFTSKTLWTKFAKDSFFKQGVSYRATNGNPNARTSESVNGFGLRLYRAGSPYPFINGFDGESFVIPDAYYTSEANAIGIVVDVTSGTTVDNQTLYPMIRLASIEDDTYAPYILDNTELASAHKLTTLTVDTTNWTQDVTSQSGTTLYKKQVSLNHVYVESPSIDIGSASGSVLPTTAQQDAYDLIQYVTVDTAIPCLYLYASDIPTDGFYINCEGVD